MLFLSEKIKVRDVPGSKNLCPIYLKGYSTEELMELARDIKANPKLYNRLSVEDFEYLVRNQIIKARSKKVIDGFNNVLLDLQKKYPNLNIDNLTVQSHFGLFDMHPYLKL